MITYSIKVHKKTAIRKAQSNEDQSATWLKSNNSNQDVLYFPEYKLTPLTVFNIWENGHKKHV
jgi:hypothetical protein